MRKIFERFIKSKKQPDKSMPYFDKNDEVLDIKFPEGHSGQDDKYYYAFAQKIRNNIRRGKRPGLNEILKETPVYPGQHILDLGAGVGNATRYFLEKNLTVTATGLSVNTFGDISKLPGEKDVRLLECYAEALPFSNNTFDAVWMSHVLEHTMNPGLALQEVRRILKDKGWLFIVLPLYKSQVVGGHLMTGWNVGQLIYVLLLNKFNVKSGHFADIQGNICGFVQKEDFELPPVNYDIGDLEILTNYWPISMRQGIEGNIKYVNWPPGNY